MRFTGIFVSYVKRGPEKDSSGWGTGLTRSSRIQAGSSSTPPLSEYIFVLVVAEEFLPL